MTVRGPHRTSRIRLALSLSAAALAAAASCPPTRATLDRAATPSPLASDGTRLDSGPPADPSRFARAWRPRAFQLPEDHGPHFQFQTEWWYFTGNLVAADGARFGFQLTFFRRGLSPGPPPEGPGLASNQVYFAHLALTDVARLRHAAVERFERGAAGLAGAKGDPFAVWLEDWRAGSCDRPDRPARPARDGDARTSGACAAGSWRLEAADPASGCRLDLVFRPEKPLVAHGDRGLSRKGSAPGDASYYVSYTRAAVAGRLALGTHEADAVGEGWFDHEWSTSALDPDAVGWDWFSLQLADGRELMFFRIRRAGGGVEPVSAGTLVAADGTTQRLALADVDVRVRRWWTSPFSGARYPSAWLLSVPSERLELSIDPLLADQEMRTSFLYWEGAVRVAGTAGGRPLAGRGYVELTGYGRSMAGVF
jgi:predicted secreted hydrolase